jgi:hypothetical protein
MAKKTMTTMPELFTGSTTQYGPQNGQLVYGEEWSSLENAIYYLAGYQRPTIPAQICKYSIGASYEYLYLDIKVPAICDKIIFWTSLANTASGTAQGEIYLDLNIESGGGVKPDTKIVIVDAATSTIVYWEPFFVKNATGLTMLNSDEYAMLKLGYKNEGEGTNFLTGFGAAFMPVLGELP